MMATTSIRKLLTFAIPCALFLLYHGQLPVASAAPIPGTDGIVDPFSGPPDDKIPGQNEFTES